MNSFVNRKNGLKRGRPQPKIETRNELIEYQNSFSVRTSHRRGDIWVLACESFHKQREDAERILYVIEHTPEFRQSGQTWESTLKTSFKTKREYLSYLMRCSAGPQRVRARMSKLGWGAEPISADELRALVKKSM